jgi:hypothetical protein
MTPVENSCAACACACGTAKHCDNGGRCRKAKQRGQIVPTICGVHGCSNPLLPGRDPRFRFVCEVCEPQYGQVVTRWPSSKRSGRSTTSPPTSSPVPAAECEWFYLSIGDLREAWEHRRVKLVALDLPWSDPNVKHPANAERRAGRDWKPPRHRLPTPARICECGGATFIDEVGDRRCTACGRYSENPLYRRRGLDSDAFRATFAEVAGKGDRDALVDDLREEGSYSLEPVPATWAVVHDGALRTRELKCAVPITTDTIRYCRVCADAVEPHRKSPDDRCATHDVADRRDAYRLTVKKPEELPDFGAQLARERDERSRAFFKARDPYTAPKDPVVSSKVRSSGEDPDPYEEAGGDMRGADDEDGRTVTRFPVGGRSAYTDYRTPIGPADPEPEAQPRDAEMAVAA